MEARAPAVEPRVDHAEEADETLRELHRFREEPAPDRLGPGAPGRGRAARRRCGPRGHPSSVAIHRDSCPTTFAQRERLDCPADSLRGAVLTPPDRRG